jgi:hypothetical protein
LQDFAGHFQPFAFLLNFTVLWIQESSQNFMEIK